MLKKYIITQYRHIPLISIGLCIIFIITLQGFPNHIKSNFINSII